MWSVCNNWEYHKKFRDNEPQGASTSLHDTTRTVIPTLRTRKPIATFRPMFPRLHTKPYNESSTACKRSSRSELWVLGHVNLFCYWGQGQIYYFPPCQNSYHANMNYKAVLHFQARVSPRNGCTSNRVWLSYIRKEKKKVEGWQTKK
jgi:hypothetical protein